MPYRKYARRSKPAAKAATRKRVVTKSRTPTREFTKKVKQILYRSAETKEAMYTDTSSVSLYHNVSNRISGNLMFTRQGTTDNPGGVAGTTLPTNLVRIGDEIQPISLDLYLQFRQPSDRPNVTFKVFILKFPGNAVPPTFIPFKSITGNVMLDPIDTEKCSIVRIKQFKHMDNYYSGAGTTPKETNFFKFMRLTFPKTKYKYGGDDLSLGHSYNLAMYVACYDTLGTLISDNIASFQWSSVLKFKDL